MRQKDDVEMARARALKAYRAAIRLKHALNADEEINQTLPLVEEDFNRAVGAGRPFRLAVGSAFIDIDVDD